MKHRVLGLPGGWLPLIPAVSCACLLVLSLSSCAERGVVREEDQARYRQLEEELLSAQSAEERQRRSEMRVAEKLRQLDEERRAATLALQSRSAAFAAAAEDDSAGSALADERLLSEVPIVTQVVVVERGADTEPTWTLQDYPDPTDGSPLCAVVSTPVDVLNGPLETRVTIIISESTVYLRTDATFDSTVPEAGYRIDAGIPIAFDRYLNELTAVVDDSYARLLDSLQSGFTLAVSFAYSPQLSSAETHVVELSLEDLETALVQLASCGPRQAEETPADAGSATSS